MRLCQLGDAKPKENLRKTKTPASPRPTWEQPQPHQIDLGATQGCPVLSAGLQTAWKQAQLHQIGLGSRPNDRETKTWGLESLENQWNSSFSGQTIEKQRLGPLIARRDPEGVRRLGGASGGVYFDFFVFRSTWSSPELDSWFF